MAELYRMLPPANSSLGLNPVRAYGRVFSCAVGSTLDVSESDTQILEANGWMRTTAEGVYTTATRPTFGVNQDGTTILDSTLGYIIVWDGAAWRNPATGAAV